MAALATPWTAMAQVTPDIAPLTEVWSPVPVKVIPGKRDADRPSDAIDLLAGLDNWESVKTPGAARWRLENGELTVAPRTGDIRTRATFGDAQLHVEWMTPEESVDKTGQNRGNSGIYLQERYEVQVLDSFTNVTYSNGQAGAIYKQFIPLVNASRPAAEWQSYDIVFTAPRFGADGKLKSPARMTVFHNGVLIQNHVELKGPTVFRGPPSYGPPHGEAPLLLQDHGHEVRFRNMWLRKL
jgi:hypothetical protein